MWLVAKSSFVTFMSKRFKFNISGMTSTYVLFMFVTSAL